MFNRDIMLEETRKVLTMLDRDLYPECYERLLQAMASGETPFPVVSDLMECDKPLELPPFLLDYITTLYRAEIEAGNDHAMCNLGAHYYAGDRGLEQDFRKAMELYTMAVEHGNRQAQENLGYCYYYGRDGKADYEKAFHCFAPRAFDGWPISLYKIGALSWDSRLFSESRERA